MKGITAVILAAVIAQVFGNLLDIFEQEGQHEPRVAIYCGHVPFYADSKTGKWVSDENGVEMCDANKEDVKRYCQRTYPKLNITNIVEANEKTIINNWCKQGSKQCTTQRKVTPYRCLVDEYEADALMVPKGCKFNHLHDQDSCMTHDEWKSRAFAYCNRSNMKLNEYGILLSCGTDMFTGVEFVCCPKRMHKKKTHKKKTHKKKTHKKKMHKIEEPVSVVDRIGLEKAIRELQKLLPEKTEGCDRTLYEQKRKDLEDRHDRKIAAVVEAWEEAESRYKKLKVEDADAAKAKMNKTLKAFRDTVTALEVEAKEERDRLKTEHSNCIKTVINKQKRDSMIAYLAAIEEKPHNVRKILKTARAFFRACEHDRLHSLRHYQHVRKQSTDTGDELKKVLLDHFEDLNKVVNSSINLLSYLPNVARKFGLRAFVALTDETQIPKLVDPVHDHKDIPKKLLKEAKKMKEVEKPEKKEHMPTKLIEKEVPYEEDHPVENDSKVKLSKNTINPTDMPPKTRFDDGEGLPENEHKLHVSVAHPHPKSQPQKKNDKKTTPDDNGHLFFKHPKSPAAFAAVIGLSCGALIIMLGSIIALVMRRNRVTQSHTLVVDAEPEDQDHLIKMQKSGYENPTYKFFYY